MIIIILPCQCMNFKMLIVTFLLVGNPIKRFDEKHIDISFRMCSITTIMLVTN
jgi:hypothetical protein